MDGAGDIKGLFEVITNEILEIVGGELIESSIKNINDVTVFYAIFDKYFFRSATNVTATMILINIADYLDVEIITSGAGEDSIFNLASSATEIYAKEIAEIFKDKGFQIVKEGK